MKFIRLSNGRLASVDDEDFPHLSQFVWCEKKRSDGHGSYAFRYIRTAPKKYRRRLMHHEIYDVSSKIRIDHRDGDGLNNQRENLRRATQTQNMQNQRTLRVSERTRQKASRFKGVSYSLVHKRDTLTKPWRCRIRVSGILINIGWFSTQEEAACAYNEAAIKHFGDFAQLNNLENQ
jgi:hypothetical protein